MKAITYTHYGTPDVLQLKEVEKPLPKDDEVLVKVHAVGLNYADWHALTGDFRWMGFGVSRPKFPIPCADFAGRVEALGRNVTQFQVGDEVYGDLSNSGWGALAEYVCAPETILAHKPVNLSFEQAAAVPMAGCTALRGLHKGGIQPGLRVAINGASGGVGTFTLQIAKALGAHVTATCSPKNMDLLYSLGSDQVVDYTREDFTQSGQLYDLIVAVNGYHPLSAYRRALAIDGTFVILGGNPSQILGTMALSPILSIGSKQTFTTLYATPNAGDLNTMKRMIEEKKVLPVVAKVFSLDQAADAFRHYGAGHVSGKIVVKVS